MLSLLTMEAALDPLLKAGMEAIRTKSVLLTEYASYLTDHLLAPLGFSLGSPRDPPDAARISASGTRKVIALVAL